MILPLIHTLDKTELTFSHAFFQTAQTLYSYLQDIQLLSTSVFNLSTEPYNIAIVSLFSKMIQSYYSYVLLEIHRERVGSQVLIEHLSSAAITLVYLLENSESQIFDEYVSGSIGQAYILLQKIETQLQPVSNNLELALLCEWLKTFVSKSELLVTNCQLPNLTADLCKLETFDMTNQRAASMGLDFLSNPARQMVHKITPSSWLDVRLNYFNAIRSRQSELKKIDFQQLRDASHLCLHATKVFLEEVNCLANNKAEIQRKQQSLSRFFEWFYQAHQVYSCHNDVALELN
ncbi:hypothetical protein B7486_47010 [cyanobacterium TDX16]|nr:hypothetical protein B7486_47010 [cyanobacterium TDX16]